MILYLMGTYLIFLPLIFLIGLICSLFWRLSAQKPLKLMLGFILNLLYSLAIISIGIMFYLEGNFMGHHAPVIIGAGIFIFGLAILKYALKLQIALKKKN